MKNCKIENCHVVKPQAAPAGAATQRIIGGCYHYKKDLRKQQREHDCHVTPPCPAPDPRDLWLSCLPPWPCLRKNTVNPLNTSAHCCKKYFPGRYLWLYTSSEPAPAAQSPATSMEGSPASEQLPSPTPTTPATTSASSADPVPTSQAFGGQGISTGPTVGVGKQYFPTKFRCPGHPVYSDGHPHCANISDYSKSLPWLRNFGSSHGMQMAF